MKRQAAIRLARLPGDMALEKDQDRLALASGTSVATEFFSPDTVLIHT
jgi:hypothetical protein